MGNTSEASDHRRRGKDGRMSDQPTEHATDLGNGGCDSTSATLVIDTSFGSTVGVVGHPAIIESDSRSHVEKLQPNIAKAVEAARLAPEQISRIVVGIGPAPFTGLRAGIVAAKALAFANGAELLGQNILEVQHRWMQRIHNTSEQGHESEDATMKHVTLAVNDARRKQLYYALYMDDEQLLPMDIDYPEAIAEKVDRCLSALADTSAGLLLDVVGHGAGRYREVWERKLRPVQENGCGYALSSVIDESVLDHNPEGIGIFAETAVAHAQNGQAAGAEPLYLRRPDVSVPKPLKAVLNTGTPDKASGSSGDRSSHGGQAQ